MSQNPTQTLDAKALEAKLLARELRERAEWRAKNEGPFTKENLIEWRAAEFLAALREAPVPSEEPVASKATAKICQACYGTGRGKGTSVTCSTCFGSGAVAIASPAVAPVASVPTDAQIKDATTEYLSHRGERPYRVLRGGQELWEAHAPAMRAAFRYALSAKTEVGP